MNIFAEFRRNVWIECSMHRLILMPFIQGILYLLPYLMMSSNGNDKYYETASYMSFWVFGILVLIWGTKIVGESVIDEVKSGTWDFQRMSSLSPISLAIGKLFGSASYVWYGGLIALGAYIFFASHYLPAGRIFETSLKLILATVLLHSTALLMSMHSIGKARLNKNFKTTQISWVLAIIIGLIFIQTLYLGVTSSDGYIETLVWFGYDIRQDIFVLLSLGAFVFWSLLGLYRQMSSELNFRHYPVAWALFLVFCIVYLNGFVYGQNFLSQIPSLGSEYPEPQHLTQFLLIAIGVAVLFLYMMIFVEPKQPATFRKLTKSVREKEWNAMFLNFPLWGVAFGFLVIFAIALLANFAIGVDAFNLSGFTLAIVLFACRDVCIMMFFSLTDNPKHSDTATMIYLAILYILFPLVFASLSSKGYDSEWMVLFFPIPSSILASVIPPLVQACIVAGLVRMRWKKLFPSV